MHQINILSKQPHLLTQSSFETSSSNEVVQAIIDGAKSKTPPEKFDNDSLPPAKAQEQTPSAESSSSKSTEGEYQKIEASDVQGPADKTSQTVQTLSSPDEASGRVRNALSSLIPPEIWVDLLPVRKMPLLVTSKGAGASGCTPISPAPKFDVKFPNETGVKDVPKQITFIHGVSSNRRSIQFLFILTTKPPQVFHAHLNATNLWLRQATHSHFCPLTTTYHSGSTSTATLLFIRERISRTGKSSGKPTYVKRTKDTLCDSTKMETSAHGATTTARRIHPGQLIVPVTMTESFCCPMYHLSLRCSAEIIARYGIMRKNGMTG